MPNPAPKGHSTGEAHPTCSEEVSNDEVSNDEMCTATFQDDVV